MPIAPVALWATSVYATSSGTAEQGVPESNVVVNSSVLPSIEILPQQNSINGSCGGASFDVNTFITELAVQNFFAQNVVVGSRLGRSLRRKAFRRPR